MTLKRVAVVEDNPDNRLLMEAILGRLFRLDLYETAAAAMAGLRNHPPGVIVMDISLPGMDGVDLLKEIRRDPNLKALPVIALTAYAMEGDRAKYLGLGFNEYLTKPILDEKLVIRTIDRFFESRSA